MLSREEKIIALVKQDIEMVNDSTLYDIFENGCIGYANMSDKEINQHYSVI